MKNLKYTPTIKFNSFGLIKNLLGFFVFSTLVFSVIINILELYPEIPLSTFFNYQINNNSNLSFYEEILSSFNAVAPTFLIILSISFFEIFKSIRTKKYSNFSIFKILQSKGHKYADIWYYFIGNLLFKFPAIVAFFTFGLSIFNDKFGKIFHEFYQSKVIIPNSQISASLIVLLAIFAKDFIGYWSHRISHMVPFLWDSHEFHHSATEMTILSSWRNDIHAQLILTPFKLPLLVLITLLTNEYLSQGYVMPLILFSIDTLLSAVATFLGHSSIKIVYPQFLSSFLMHPAQHWLHHSENVEHYDCNFGEKYNFWDKLFGTYLNVENVENIRGFGVPKTQYNKFHPLYSYIILPLVKMSKRFKINFLRV